MKPAYRLLLAIAILLVGTALASFASSPVAAASIQPGKYARTTTGLNERSGPGMNYQVKRVIPSDGQVRVNSGPYNGGWYKVSYKGTQGYVWQSYLRQNSNSNNNTGTTQRSSTQSNANRYATTTAALNERSGPGVGYNVLRVIPYHGKVRVTSGPVNGNWYKVTYNGTMGYSSGTYLSFSNTAGTQPPKNNPPSSTSSTAYTTARLNLRSGAGFGYNVYLVIPDGAQVQLLGGPVNGNWYRVSYSGTTGYAYGSYISRSGSQSGYQANKSVWHGNYPAKWIDINLSTQSMAAFQRGTLIRSTEVTTGNYRYPSRRTPTGVYHVMAKLSPHWFISPWPEWSFWYYEPSKATYALRFRDGGYYIHDAPWRSNFGPGSNMSYGSPGGDYTGSHGCVNTPPAMMQWLYQWANEGTPVVIHY